MKRRILLGRLEAHNAKGRRYAGSRAPAPENKFICDIAADSLIEDVRSDERTLSLNVRLRLEGLVAEGRVDSIFQGKKDRSYKFSSTTKDVFMDGGALRDRIVYHMPFIIGLVLKRLENDEHSGDAATRNKTEITEKPHGDPPASGNTP